MKKQLLVGAMLMGAFFTASAQDDCANAATISIGTTTVGTIDGEYEGGCWGAGAAVPMAEWYKFTATEDGMIRLNTDLDANDPAVVDTRIGVYTGACGDLECWSGQDDIDPAQTGGNYLTNFTFPVNAGETYYVVFDNRWAAASFDVEMTMDSTPECAVTAPLNEDWSNEANYYFCWAPVNTDSDVVAWQYNSVNDLNGDGNDDAAAMIFPDIQAAPTGISKNDWLVSGNLNMAAGSEYTISVTYNAVDFNATYMANEDLTIAMIPADEEMDIIELGTIDGITMEGTLATLMQDALTQEYTFTPEAGGMYSVGLLAESNGDTGILVIFDVEVDGLAGTDDVLASKFSVFPNPATDVINIANAENMLVNGVTITDINGRTVKSAQFEGTTNATVNVSDLASGVYMMTVSSDKGTAVKKIVKN